MTLNLHSCLFPKTVHFHTMYIVQYVLFFCSRSYCTENLSNYYFKYCFFCYLQINSLRYHFLCQIQQILQLIGTIFEKNNLPMSLLFYINYCTFLRTNEDQMVNALQKISVYNIYEEENGKRIIYLKEKQNIFLPQLATLSRTKLNPFSPAKYIFTIVGHSKPY